MKIIGLEIYYVVRYDTHINMSNEPHTQSVFFNLIFLRCSSDTDQHQNVLCLSLFLCLYSGVLDPSLKAALESFSSKRRYEFWSDYVRDLVCLACDGEEEGLRSLSESQMLISAWRTLLILSTSHVRTTLHPTHV